MNDRKTTRALRGLLGIVLSLSFSACEGACGPSTEDGGTGGPMGRIALIEAEGGFDIVLEDLDASLRALQVNVELSGTRATEVRAIGAVSHDVLEAGLDSPQSRFTVVLSDTRRIAIEEGPVVRVLTEAGGSAELSGAVAVDVDGQRGTLETGASQ